MKFASIIRMPEITNTTANAFHSINAALLTRITMLTGRQISDVAMHGIYFLMVSDKSGRKNVTKIIKK